VGLAVTLADLLWEGQDATGAGDPGAPLVHVRDRSWSRREVQAMAEGLAASLAEAGLVAGQPVGVMLPNGVGPVAALFGVWRAGGVYVPLNPRLTDDEIGHVLRSVGPAVVVTTEDLAARFPDRPVVAVGGLDGDGGGPRWVVRPGPRVEAPIHDGDVALIQFTSGTTGRPKPVLLLHSGVLTLLEGVLRKLRASSGGAKASSGAAMPNLVPVSLSLWAGLYNVLFALLVGAPVVVMDGFDTHEFAELVARFSIRSTVLPPAAMTMLVDDETIEDLAPLRFVRGISSPLSPLQARRFKDRFGIAVLNSYGQTEIGGEIVGWNAADSREHGETKLGSVGRPHEGVELRIVDEGGADVDPGGSGELWVRTPALSAGYADGGDLDDRLAPGGWFRTGDVGHIDDDGFVWVEGRVSSMINRGGLKVHPGEVEEVLRLHPSVVDVAVVGVPDDRLGEVPWAFVVTRDGTVDPAELTATARSHLAPYKVPVRFEPVASLPRNEVGKVLGRELVERARAGS
jgi:long-chain acyl-CoA synthetase